VRLRKAFIPRQLLLAQLLKKNFRFCDYSQPIRVNHKIAQLQTKQIIYMGLRLNVRPRRRTVTGQKQNPKGDLAFW